MNPRSRISLLLVLGSGLALLGGCGGGDRLDTGRVSGTVTLDGNPLTKGTVIFAPERGRAATGTIRADGSYTLGTYTPGDGAVLGKHRVSVMAREDLPNRGPLSEEVGPSLIPEFYSDSAKSGLTFNVEGGLNNCDIKLSSTTSTIKSTHP